MNRSIRSISLVLACAGAMLGCGTPQPALDQANNGAALTVSLQAQLKELRAEQANIAKARVERIRQQHARIATYAAASAFDERVRVLAGDAAGTSLVTELRALTDSRAQDEQNLREALAAIDTSMASLLDPIPPQDDKLAATQKAMAALAEEFPIKQRIRIIAEFAGEVKKSIDDTKKKTGPDAGDALTKPLEAKAGETLADSGTN